MKQVETIGRYVILHRLEIGERDAVYLAEDPILMRRVAIKVVREGLAEKGQALARFRRAAKVSAALKHPHIVSVLEVGEDPMAGPFVVMEFVDGPSLADLAEVGPLDLEARLRWLLQIMRALEVAHASGIVHGNVKLSKVLVNRQRVAKLTGFTSAADLAARASGGKILSIGSGVGASAAADRYTFSVMALELLNQEWSQAARASSADVAQGGAEPRGAAAGEQPSLVAVFERALAEDPAERFADIESFMGELIDASPLDASVRAQLHTAFRARQLAEEAPAPSPLRAGRGSGADERAEVAPYRRALVLAMVGMAAVAVVAVGMNRLTREVPQAASARKLYVISSPQGATIMVDAKRLGETPRRVFVDPEARRLRLESKGYRAADFNLRGGQDDIQIAMEPLAAEARRAPLSRVATRKVATNKVATKKPIPAVLASPDNGPEPGGLFVVVGRGLDTVGNRFAGVGRTMRGWLTPEQSRQ